MTKLTRNEGSSNDYYGKYAILRLDKIRTDKRFEEFLELMRARSAETDSGFFKYVELGAVGNPDEFFVLKLKDKFAPWALIGYVDGIQEHIHSLTDPKEVAEWSEFAEEVRKLADRAHTMTNRKLPD